MSNTVESPSQSSPGKPTSKIKKARQKRGKGIKNAKKDRVTPISKYLVKEEDKGTSPSQPETPGPSSQGEARLGVATIAPPTAISGAVQSSGSLRIEGESAGGRTVTSELQPPNSPPIETTTQEVGQSDERKPQRKDRESSSGDDRCESGGNTFSRVSSSKGDIKSSASSRGRDVVRGIRGGGRQQPQQQARGERSCRGGQRGGRTQDEDYSPASGRRQIQMSIRDHFPVRRSSRRTKSEIKKEAHDRTAQRLRDKDESGLKVVEIEGKGRGVVSTRSFSQGELVCEYSGELISHEEAKKREEEYRRDTSIGCYMYYFTYKTRKLCVDATTDNGRKGRLLNHSRTSANVVTKLLEVDDKPYLCLVAARDINVGEQLEYDYGERNKEAMDSHPWLAT